MCADLIDVDLIDEIWCDRLPRRLPTVCDTSLLRRKAEGDFALRGLRGISSIFLTFEFSVVYFLYLATQDSLGLSQGCISGEVNIYSKEIATVQSGQKNPGIARWSKQLPSCLAMFADQRPQSRQYAERRGDIDAVAFDSATGAVPKESPG